MTPEIERAMREVLEAWETPDSPEALAAAMYQMKRVHRAAAEDAKARRKPGRPRKKCLRNDPALATRGLEPAPENHMADGQPSGLPAAHGSASEKSPTNQ